MTSTIQISVDDDVAALYNSASEQDKLKIGILLGLWLRETRESGPDVLDRIMNRISANAQARGLTPEILEEILADDD